MLAEVAYCAALPMEFIVHLYGMLWLCIILAWVAVTGCAGLSKL